MSDTHRRFDHSKDLIADMESTVGDVSAWAKPLQAVGTSALPVDAIAVTMMAVALEGVADCLADYWSEAFELTHSKAKPETT